MGISLKILIVDGQLSGQRGYSHSMFAFGQCRDLFEKLDAKARTIPGFRLSSYVARIPDGSWEGENGYGDVAETPYGEPLTFVSAAEFLEAIQPADIEDNGGWLARAARAYIACLPPDTWVGLYYH